MQIVILNTLGKNFSRKDVFFRAFSPDELTWIDAELGSVGECAAQITELLAQQTVQRDHHLVITVDLEPFAFSEYANARDRLKRLIQAYIVRTLIDPLVKAERRPAGVSIVFTYYKHLDDKTAPIGQGILGVLSDAPEADGIPALAYSDAEGRTGYFDLSCVLPRTDTLCGDEPSGGETAEEPEAAGEAEEIDELKLQSMRIARQLDDEEKKAEQSGSSQLEETYSNMVNEAQQADVPGNAALNVAPTAYELRFRSPNIKNQNADLQINLAGLFRALLDSAALKDKEFAYDGFRAHTNEELKELLVSALARVNALLETKNKAEYYPLNELYDDSTAAGIIVELNKKLEKEIPKALEECSEDELASGVPESDFAATQKLRGAVIALNRAQMSFRQEYKAFLDRYDGEKAEKQENAVFNACATEYANWRRETRLAHRTRIVNRSERQRPGIPKQTYEELDKARALSESGALEALREFGDAKEEASALKERFLQETRVWSPDSADGGTKKFYRFCAVAAVIFVLIMIVPFMLLDSQTYGSSVAIPLVHLTGGAVFLLVYAWVVLRWLRRRCSKVNELRLDLSALTHSCAKEREASIELAKKVYGKYLPDCMIRQMNLEYMEQYDGLNADIEKKVELHCGYLTEIKNEIKAIFTALGIDSRSAEAVISEQTENENHANIDWQQAPYAKVNRDAYMPFNTRKE